MNALPEQLILHRGRLDGSARVLVLGQDPAQHESIVRRVLVGGAGQRVQGLLAKLGINRSYVMVNTFLYRLYGSGGAGRWDDDGIVEYRHRWLDALLLDSKVEAVIAIGSLAGDAIEMWREASGSDVWFERCIHPTFHESASGGDPAAYASSMKRMLEDWNAALEALSGVIDHPDVTVPAVPYGASLKASDLASIPEIDMPAGLPVDALADEVGGQTWNLVRDEESDDRGADPPRRAPPALRRRAAGRPG